MSIFIVGFKSAGKTTLAQSVAHQRSLDFIDLDRHIAFSQDLKKQTQRTCSELYSLNKKAFRKQESAMLKRLSKLKKFSVVATGGGASEHMYLFNHIKKKHLVIFLNTPLKIILERLQTAKTYLGQPATKEWITYNYTKRYHLYQRISRGEIDGSLPVNEQTDQLINHLL